MPVSDIDINTDLKHCYKISNTLRKKQSNRQNNLPRAVAKLDAAGPASVVPHPAHVPPELRLQVVLGLHGGAVVCDDIGRQ